MKCFIERNTENTQNSEEFPCYDVKTTENLVLCAFSGMMAHTAAATFVRHFNAGTLEGSDDTTSTINQINEINAPVEHAQRRVDHQLVDGKIMISIEWSIGDGLFEKTILNFDSIREKEEFLRGTNEAIAWSSYKSFPDNSEDSFYRILWGNNPDAEASHAVTYNFSNAIEKKAFISGVEYAIKAKTYKIKEFDL